VRHPEPAGVVNAFSIDVEDYFHVEALAPAIDRREWDRFEYRAEDNTRRVLDLLAAEGVRATFFVLGWIAKRSPQLVRDIRAAGHEVACHGLNHQLVYKQSRDVFLAETREAKQRLEDATGVAVHGYRA
jgi:polysaccharide deacetylase family protein (PEP-CTERM system associated)